MENTINILKQEKHKQICKKYYDAHKAEISAQKKDYYIQNRDDIIQKNSLRQKVNPEQQKEQFKKRYQLNKEKFSQINKEAYIKRKNKQMDNHDIA